MSIKNFPKSAIVRGLVAALLVSVICFVALFFVGCTTTRAQSDTGYRTITGPSMLLEGAPDAITTGHVNEELDHRFFVWTVARDKGTDSDCAPLTPNIWPHNQVFEVTNGSAKFWVREGEVLCVAPVGNVAGISWHASIEPIPYTRSK